jgi:hypothetical protein
MKLRRLAFLKLVQSLLMFENNFEKNLHLRLGKEWWSGINQQGFLSILSVRLICRFPC